MVASREPRPRSNPRRGPADPNLDSGLVELRNPTCSLAESLQPTVDDARQLVVDFGLRPYTVHSVVVAWSGGDVGRGSPAVISDTPLLPTPQVSLEPLRGESRSAGLVERGTITMDRISTRYTEDDIRTLFFVFPLPKGHKGFIEVQKDARDGETTRRRFTVIGTPAHRPMKFDWRVRLLGEDENRDRAGTPHNVRSQQAVFTSRANL